MKSNFFILIILVCSLSRVGAQSTDQNYIQVYDVKATLIIDPNDLTSSTPSEIALQTIRYFDGVGRLKQTIDKGFAPDKTLPMEKFNDLIHPVKYNAVGLDEINYQPYCDKNDDGSFRNDNDIPTGVYDFYSSLFSDGNGTAPTMYEASPLSRKLSQGAPGSVWQTDHVQTFDYLTNSDTDPDLIVREWNIIDNACKTEDIYSPNQLYANKVVDENGNRSYTFKDKQNRIVLERNVLGTSQYADTYYVYDDYGLLRFVISPEGIARLQSSFYPEDDFAKRYVYCYKYDGKHRLIEKQIPGKAPEYFVYNINDQLILTQDGNNRKECQGCLEWRFKKYDGLGREIISGITYRYQQENREELQHAADEVTVCNEFLFSELEFPKYGNKALYTCRTFPYEDNSLFTILNVNYFDTYHIWVYDASQHLVKTNIYGSNIFNFVGPNNSLPISPELNHTTGKLCITKTDLNSTQLCSVDYYDIYDRHIQKRATNQTGQLDWTTSQYDGLTSNVIHSESNHAARMNGIQYEYREETDYSFDEGGRLLTTEYSFDGHQFKQVTHLTYNPLSKVVRKQIGQDDYLMQTINYEYNIKGWLTMINDPRNIDSDGDFFGERLYYDERDNDINNTPQYNGNISACIWQTGQPNGLTTPNTRGLKSYIFDYDNMNRLTNSTYSEFIDGEWESNKYNEQIIDQNSNATYDMNGNILGVVRKGLLLPNNSPGEIDHLKYTYNGNQLIAVDDEVNFNNGNDFFDNNHYYSSSQTPEYVYDANGNLIEDVNKGIISITYDYNNMPISVDKRNECRVAYKYDANGIKREQTVFFTGELTKATEFIDNFVFENGEPAYVLYDDGRVVFSKDRYFGEAYIKDHLGSVRATCRMMGHEIILTQVDSYYPCGLNNLGLSGNTPKIDQANKYLYNSKMIQDEMKLNWLDYGARYYDPVLGKWNAVDVMAEKHPGVSAYSFCDLNPIIYIDPNGKDWYKNSDGEIEWTQATSKSDFIKLKLEGQYLGKTYTDNKGTYYSLFGDKLQSKSVLRIMTQKIDDGFIKYAKYLTARNNSWSNSVYDQEDHDPYQELTDFSGVYEFNPNPLVTYDNSHDFKNGYHFASNVRLNVSLSTMKARFESFLTDPKRIVYGGSLAGNWKLEGYHVRFENSTRSDVVIITFNSKENYRALMNEFNRIFNLN